MKHLLDKLRIRILRLYHSLVGESFQKRLLYGFALVAVIPLLISGMLSVRLFQMKISQDYQRLDLTQNEVLEQLFEDYFSTLDQVSEEIQSSPAVMQMLSEEQNSSIQVYRALYSSTSAIRDLATVELYSGSTCAYSTRRGQESHILPEGFGILRMAKEASGTSVWSADPEAIFAGESGLIMGRQIYSGEKNGYVVFRMSETQLENLISGKLDRRDSITLLNDSWEILYSTGDPSGITSSEKMRSNLFAGRSFQDGLDGNSFLSQINSSGIYLLYHTPSAIDESTASSMTTVIVLLTAGCLLISLFLSHRLSHLMTRPLTTLTNAMRKLRHGSLDTRVTEVYYDEFGQLSDGFNKMADRITTMMEEKVEQQKELDRVEMEMMQAQLNPHFLYNTLDTIKWMAKSRKVPEIATLSSSLARILRQSISEKQFCTLADEESLLLSYFEIQSFRFDNRYELILDLDENTKDAVIPKLILQPLVENSLIHGLADLDEGYVKVTSRFAGEQSDRLELSVTDNGVGISEEFLEQFEASDEEALAGHIGMKNVDRVLRLHYGKAYGLRAARAAGGGTCITLTLPYTTEFTKNR